MVEEKEEDRAGIQMQDRKTMLTVVQAVVQAAAAAAAAAAATITATTTPPTEPATWKQWQMSHLQKNRRSPKK